MKLTWYGHACFLLESDGGMRLLTDPYPQSIYPHGLPRRIPGHGLPYPGGYSFARPFLLS